MNINKINICFVSVLLLCSETSQARYKSQQLQRIDTAHTQIDTSKNESFAFNHKILHARDCKKYFNTTTMLKKGYQPIQITFTNNSKNSVAISPDSFSFRCANSQDVANSLHRDGMARGIGFGIGALWFFPLIFPALIQGLGANDYNVAMDIDFAQKSLKNQVVPPYTTVEGVIFVSSHEFHKNFTLTVKGIDQQASHTLHALQRSSRTY